MTFRIYSDLRCPYTCINNGEEWLGLRDIVEKLNDQEAEILKWRKICKDSDTVEWEHHLHRLNVFQKYAQKYEYGSREHNLIVDIAREIGLPIGILGDINNRAEEEEK